MPEIQSVFGKVSVFEDFMGLLATTTISDATALRYNGLSLIAISGDTDVVSTVDESGGVFAFTGAGGAGDGVAIITSPFVPTRGGTAVIEVRFKNSSATDFRFFCGFQETVSLTETVNPYTLSGSTLTANAAGEVAGFYYDSQATTDDFRFMAGANSSASTSARAKAGPKVAGLNSNPTTLGTLGIRAGATLTADRWMIARVEMDPDGTARGYFGEVSMAGSQVHGPTLIATLETGELSTTAVYYPIVQLLAQSTGDPTPEIDYFGHTVNRDWNDD